MDIEENWKKIYAWAFKRERSCYLIVTRSIIIQKPQESKQ